MGFRDRIRLIRGGLTYEQFGKELSKAGYTFTKGNLWRYENDDSLKPSFPFFFAVATLFKVNLNWLITGRGEMNLDESKLKKRVKRAKEKPKVLAS